MHTFEHRLNCLYTWRQQAKKGKAQKNTVQMRHSCALFDALSIFVEYAATRRRYMMQMREHLFPLSITDGEGARGQERYGVSLQRPAILRKALPD